RSSESDGRGFSHWPDPTLPTLTSRGRGGAAGSGEAVGPWWPKVGSGQVTGESESGKGSGRKVRQICAPGSARQGRGQREVMVTTHHSLSLPLHRK
ncbi:Hemoglobin cathodic subunit alpha, partial [Frankliniella fusca]